jgi:AAA15 family ATPase/GTPase
MLEVFKVKNFKNFKEELILNLGNIKDYEFNSEAVSNGIINKAIVYGINASGKSNLGYAIFDIIKHTSDKENVIGFYTNYKNAENINKPVEFYYKFKFGNDYVEYSYSKDDYSIPFFEEVKINNETVIKYDYKSMPIIELEEAKNLKRKIENEKLSIVKYIKNNVNYSKKSILGKFFNFIDSMLWFRSIRDNAYMGFQIGSTNLSEYIIINKLTEKFQNFLGKFEIAGEISTITDIMGKGKLAFKFGENKIPFDEIASSGTSALWLFFVWYEQLKNVSFLFIDEFDAYYHQDLSESIVKLLIKNPKKVQTILTTHSTSLMTNDLLRPDCYFILDNNKIKQLFDLTEKELRRSHNLEKMYRAGVFYEEN